MNVVIDVEADGPYPGDYSMVSFGAVIVKKDIGHTFYAQIKPISDKWIPDALAVSGHTREECMTFRDPVEVMTSFAKWLTASSKSRPTFFSDNVAFDWQFINYYFHKYYGSNPFGFSGRRIGDIYCGMKKDLGKNSEWKKLYRKTKHTHRPVDDAMGNAEALIAFRDSGLKGF